MPASLAGLFLTLDLSEWPSLVWLGLYKTVLDESKVSSLNCLLIEDSLGIIEKAVCSLQCLFWGLVLRIRCPYIWGFYFWAILFDLALWLIPFRHFLWLKFECFACTYVCRHMCLVPMEARGCENPWNWVRSRSHPTNHTHRHPSQSDKYSLLNTYPNWSIRDVAQTQELKATTLNAFQSQIYRVKKRKKEKIKQNELVNWWREACREVICFHFFFHSLHIAVQASLYLA